MRPGPLALNRLALVTHPCSSAIRVDGAGTLTARTRTAPASRRKRRSTTRRSPTASRTSRSISAPLALAASLTTQRDAQDDRHRVAAVCVLSVAAPLTGRPHEEAQGQGRQDGHCRPVLRRLALPLVRSVATSLELILAATPASSGPATRLGPADLSRPRTLSIRSLRLHTLFPVAPTSPSQLVLAWLTGLPFCCRSLIPACCRTHAHSAPRLRILAMLFRFFASALLLAS